MTETDLSVAAWGWGWVGGSIKGTGNFGGHESVHCPDCGDDSDGSVKNVLICTL